MQKTVNPKEENAMFVGVIPVRAEDVRIAQIRKKQELDAINKATAQRISRQPISTIPPRPSTPPEQLRRQRVDVAKSTLVNQLERGSSPQVAIDIARGLGIYQDGVQPLVKGPTIISRVLKRLSRED